MPEIEIFTDGACRGNPGPGGWGAILRFGATVKELSGAVPETTNNRMELSAAIEALRALRETRYPVLLTTDSRYVMDGITQWLPNWKRRGWTTSDRKPVKNKDLWLELDQLVGAFNLQWRWVKGHSGHAENERVDELANLAINAMLEKKAP